MTELEVERKRTAFYDEEAGAWRVRDKVLVGVGDGELERRDEHHPAVFASCAEALEHFPGDELPVYVRGDDRARAEAEEVERDGR